MSYATQKDAEDRWGRENIATWGNLDGDTAAARKDRVDAAIRYADGYINDRFRGGRYTVPFAALDTTALDVVRTWATALVAWWLRGSRPEGGEADPLAEAISNAKEAADDEMGAYLSGQRSLNAQPVTAGSGGRATAPVVV